MRDSTINYCDKKINDSEPKRRATMVVSNELLHGILKFPDTIRIIGIEPSMEYGDIDLRILLEGEALPENCKMSQYGQKPCRVDAKYKNDYVPIPKFEGFI